MLRSNFGYFGKMNNKSKDRADKKVLISLGKIQKFNKMEGQLSPGNYKTVLKEEEGDQEKDVNLDAILENAEMREEEEAPISKANKELLNAFKCTTLQFEETEKDYEMEGW